MSERADGLRERAIDLAFQAYRQGAPWEVETGVDATLSVVADAIRDLTTGEQGVRLKDVVDFKRELLAAIEK